VLALVVCGLALGVPAAFAGTYTWTGADSIPGWSSSDNWSPTDPSGTGNTLNFPALSGSCDTCTDTEMNLADLGVDFLNFTGSSYVIGTDGSNSLGLGSPGISATGSAAAVIATPLDLDGNQTWTITDSDLDVDGGFSNNSQGLSLNASLGSNGVIEFGASSDVGPVDITGASSADAGSSSIENGLVALDAGDDLNGSDGNPVAVSDVSLYAAQTGVSAASIGPLTATGAELLIGEPEAPTGGLDVDGGVTLDSGTELVMFEAGSGTTANIDFTQLSATGTVDLGGAQLLLAPVGGATACAALTVGQADQIVTTTGSVTGQFGNAANGAILAYPCSATTEEQFQINYLPSSVTATYEGTVPIPTPPPPTQATPTAPTATTSAPTVTSTTGATASASVNPNGLATTVEFQYGLTTAYGQTTAAQTIAAGTSPQTVTAPLTGLLPNSTYHLRVVAKNALGTSYGSDQTFKTPSDPPPPPPVLGKAVNVEPVSGTVLIKLPHGASLEDFQPSGLFALFAGPLVKGRGFTPLTEARQIPVGSQIDARQGTLAMITASTAKHKTYSGDFGGGLFGVLTQTRKQKGLTNLGLLEGSFPGAPSYANRCVATGKASIAAGAKHLSKSVVDLLKASAHGQFATKGKYGAATVRGTSFTIEDRCDGTFTTVQRGVVAVRDFATRRTITLHAGRSFLARR
jgi:hypothetical protein